MKKYRRRIGTTTDTRSAAVAVAIGAILAVTACGSGGDGAADSSSGAGASDQKVQAAAKNDKAIAQLPDEIKKRGEIVVAMDFSDKCTEAGNPAIEAKAFPDQQVRAHVSVWR